MVNSTNGMFKGALFFVGTFFILLGVAYTVSAEDGVPERGIQISPSKIILTSTPGSDKEFFINVKNYDKLIAHKVVVDVEDFYVTNESVKAQFFKPDQNHRLKAYDVIDWIEVEREFILEPGEAKDVRIKVNIPKKTSTGGYYGVIFFQTSESRLVKNEEEDSSDISVNYRVGTLLINAVEGNEAIKIDGKVERIAATKKFFWKSPIGIIADLYSSGNIHYKAGGKITVEKFGKTFAILDVKDEVMYPNRTRTFLKTAKAGILDIGVYRAVLDMKSEGGDVTFQAVSPVFFVVPWQLIVAAVVTVIVFRIVVYAFHKKVESLRRRKRRRRR